MFVRPKAVFQEPDKFRCATFDLAEPKYAQWSATGTSVAAQAAPDAWEITVDAGPVELVIYVP